MKKLACILLLIALFAACKNNRKKTLPFYGNRHAVTRTVNGQTVTDTVYQTIPAFKYVNQYGDSTGSKNLDGDIYVADFFFTTCPSICPIMQRNMLNVYNAFKDSTGVKIISFTIDPKHGNTWWFLRGDRDAVYQLAKSYLVSVSPDSTTAGNYIHDGYFVLIDKQKRIRGSYDGTQPKQVEQLIDDIKTLKAK
jgi:protein SCO1/2